MPPLLPDRRYLIEMNQMALARVWKEPGGRASRSNAVICAGIDPEPVEARFCGMSSCAGSHAMAMRQPLTFDGVHGFLDTLFGDDLHAKRVKSFAGPRSAVGLLGQGLARAADQARRQAGGPAVVHRGIDVDALPVHWVPYVVGQRDSITVAMDWTEFDAGGQATIMLSLLSRHGRVTPLAWLTVDKAALKNRRNGYEYQVLVQLAEILPADVRVRIVADRGFGDQTACG
jgi:hypothetical protein